MTINTKQIVKLNQLYEHTLDCLASFNPDTVDNALGGMKVLNEVFSILGLPTDTKDYAFIQYLNEHEEEAEEDNEAPEMFPGIKGMLDNITF